MGLSWTVSRTGVGEIDGVRQDVRRAFSRRRQEIEARLQERHETSSRAAQIATLETRKAKQYGVDERTLLDDWRERANEFGFTPASIADLLAAGRQRAQTVQAPAAPTDYLLSQAGLTAHASTFGERDVLQAYARAVPDGASVATVCRWSEELISGPELIRLPTRGVRRRSDVLCVRSCVSGASRLVPLGASEGRFTTPDMLAVEQQLMTSATSRRGTRTAEALVQSVNEALAARPYLSGEQIAMVRDLTSAGDGVSAVNAMAGAGKTTAMAAAAEAWTESGYRVVGACLSAKAASVLREEAGVPAFTLAQVLNEVRHPDFRGFPANTVLVIDEAGQAGSRTLHELEGHLSRNGCKLVLVGDLHQLPEIDAGGAFRGLVDRLPSVELTRNQRQTNPRERDWLRELRNGDVGAAVRAYDEAGRIVVGGDPDELRDRLVSDWLAAWRSTEEYRRADVAMLAVTNVDVEDLNLRARRMLTDGELTGPTLNGGGRDFQAGDHVVTRMNDYSLGVLNGQRWVVDRVNPDRQSATLICRGASGLVIEVPEGYSAAGWLQHAYAVTTSVAQGVTLERSFILGSDAMYREAGYTAASRARKETRFYVARDAPGREVEGHHAITIEAQADSNDLHKSFEESLRQSRAKDLALDSPSEFEPSYVCSRGGPHLVEIEEASDDLVLS